MNNTGMIDMDKYKAMPDLLTAHEAAAICRCGERSIANRCKDGTFRAVKASKGWRINKDDVLKYAGLIW